MSNNRQVYTLREPGTRLDISDSEKSRHISILLSSIKSAFYTAHAALWLYNQIRENNRVMDLEEMSRSLEDRQKDIEKESIRVEEIARSIGAKNVFDIEAFDKARIIFRIEKINSGERIISIERNFTFIQAHAFLYALDELIKTALKLQKPGVSNKKVEEVITRFQAEFSDLIQIRNSAHHREDRILGLAIVKNKLSPVKPRPVQDGAIYAPSGAMLIGNLVDGSLSYTIASGEQKYIEISFRTIERFGIYLQEILDAFEWTGPENYLPTV